jgi:hypothetical protein
VTEVARSGKPEYAIILAAIGVLVAVGMPAIARGEPVLGWGCLALAVGLVGAGIVSASRSRR